LAGLGDRILIGSSTREGVLLVLGWMRVNAQQNETFRDVYA